MEFGTLSTTIPACVYPRVGQHFW